MQTLLPANTKTEELFWTKWKQRYHGLPKVLDFIEVKSYAILSQNQIAPYYFSRITQG